MLFMGKIQTAVTVRRKSSVTEIGKNRYQTRTTSGIQIFLLQHIKNALQRLCYREYTSDCANYPFESYNSKYATHVFFVVIS